MIKLHIFVNGPRGKTKKSCMIILPGLKEIQVNEYGEHHVG